MLNLDRFNMHWSIVMNSIFIPQSRSTLTTQDDWPVTLDWDSANLVLLREFNLTGQKAISQGAFYVPDGYGGYQKDEHGNFVRRESFRNVTVPNRLFEDDNGDFTPVIVTIPAHTEFFITKYHTGYQGMIKRVSLKILTCPGKPKLRNKCLLVELDQFNRIGPVVISAEEN